jgi:hypothetical protein
MATLDIRGVVVLFDDADLELVSRHKWWITPQGYAVTKIKRTDGLKKDKGRRTIGMHRLILGDPDTPATDHINRDRLDNRRCNLRACTDSHNNRNRPTVAGKFSKHRGVTFVRGKWQVVIRVGGVLKFFGYHATEEAAAAIAAPYFADIVV